MLRDRVKFSGRVARIGPRASMHRARASDVILSDAGVVACSLVLSVLVFALIVGLETSMRGSPL